MIGEPFCYGDWKRCVQSWLVALAKVIHRKTAEWFDEPEIYHFIGSYLRHIPQLSMRYYEKAKRLRNAGFLDWQKSLLQMMLSDRTVAVVAGLQLDPLLSNETQRIKQFTAETGLSRATYFRVKANLLLPMPPPRNVLRRSTTLRLVKGDL